MNPKPTRPVGVTFLAVAFLWIGFCGAIFVPILGLAGGLVLMGQVGTLFHSMPMFKAGAYLTGAYLLLGAWYLMYLLYIAMGFGFWKRKNWARQVAIVLFTVFGVLGLVLTPFFAKSAALSVAMIVAIVSFNGWIVWYLLRPRVRYAFGVWPAESEYPPGLSKVGKTGVVLAIIAIFAVYFVALLIFVEGMMRQSDVYKMTLQQAQNSPCVNTLIGSPLTPGWMISGDEQTSDTDGSADLSFPVRGPKGKGSLEVAAKKQGGVWKINSLNLLRGAEKTEIVPALPNTPCH